MAGEGLPRWNAVFVAVAVAASVFGATFALSEWNPSRVPSAGVRCDGHNVSVDCPLVNSTITYASEQYLVEAAGGNGNWFGPTNTTWFGGVEFVLFPEVSGSDITLWGSGHEPNGIHLELEVCSCSATAVNTSWFSPDGVFGVSYISWGAPDMAVRLWVASPSVTYDERNATLNPVPSSPGNDTPSRVSVDNVTFTMEIFTSFGGVELSASAAVPGEDSVSLVLVYSMAASNATYEASGPGHSVGLYWDGAYNVTALVRTR